MSPGESTDARRSRIEVQLDAAASLSNRSALADMENNSSQRGMFSKVIIAARSPVFPSPASGRESALWS